MTDKEIVVVKGDQIFGFQYDLMEVKYMHYSREFCEFCGNKVSSAYAYIIYKLRGAKLLSREYPLVCCFCYHHVMWEIECQK
jgi:hypothetical protein